MKAAVHDRYGGPDVLRIEDLPNPHLGPGDVSVRVRAASINEWDHGLLAGTPLVNRTGGLRQPKLRIIGSDIAGTVEAVGPEATRFLPGDEVMGDLSASGFGAFAEYACAPESALTHKPGFLSWVEAAAVPQAGGLAVGALRRARPYRPGLRVLINGAGGGVGTLAIQIAKHLQAEVTAVDGPAKLPLLVELGADHVIDYTLEDFTRSGDTYDVIIDVLSRRTPMDYLRALRPRGAAVIVGGGSAQLISAVGLGPFLLFDHGKRLGLFLYRPNQHPDVALLLDLLEQGAVHPVVDRTFPLADAPAAMQHYADGSFVGKIVLTM